MKDAGDIMAGLARPMQHAVNNLVMVMQANMDSVLASLPPEDRASVRLTRAAHAGREMEALVRAFLRLGRPEEHSAVDSGRFFTAVQPVLQLAAGRPLTVETVSTATIMPRRPQVDLALVDAFTGARELPRATLPTVRLEGAGLQLNWPLPEGSRAALEDAGITLEETEAGPRLLLSAA
ncbi:hypothetical protein [Roseomonas marmotae]|uniref:Signal transduction histidine kinase dimerisation/phosphoacceptor domain-containing protein n=1 Tax=Roseomonas marmotae TaxID=2768161 RepID=A0ABS3KCP2_9PROT|nr:hypothetical protein [Roseomonas marmotae]MBO1075236.1 hypothetical protein [Roseomonas marmotae]QTI79658.1 hypothetical protein IAI58_02295 [Roseomonas marmotae]